MKCKNDSTKSYKGTEPSPKGLGYCAHAEKYKTVRVGLDGNKWIIATVSNGSKRWVKLSTNSKNKSTTSKNKYKTKSIRASNIKNNKSKKIKSTLPKNTKSYFTHFNGGRPYLVYIYEANNKKKVSIYKFDDKKYEADNNSYGNKEKYVSFVKKYSPTAVMIGKSPKNKMTTFSAGFGPKFDGNSILLYLGKTGNKYKYVFIMDKVEEFTTDSEIIKFVSPVGNSDVPYPYAFDKNNKVYLLSQNIIITNENNFITPQNEEPYTEYYNKENKAKLQTKRLIAKIIDKVDY
jgi:hypothetical protein